MAIETDRSNMVFGLELKEELGTAWKRLNSLDYFEWTNGQEFDYSNWVSGQPTSSTDPHSYWIVRQTICWLIKILMIFTELLMIFSMNM